MREHAPAMQRTVAVLGALVVSLSLVLATATPTTAEPVTVSAEAWSAWLVQHQRAFVEQTRDIPLDLTLKIAGDGGSARAAVSVNGTVNPDGTMLVSLAGPGGNLTILCSKPSRCFARHEGGRSDRLWHRIPAREVATLRDPLPTQDTPLPDDATYSTDGDTARASYLVDDVVLQVAISFAGGGYRETGRISVPSDGVEMSYAKSLTATVKVDTPEPRPRLVGSPLGVDVIPQLP